MSPSVLLIDDGELDDVRTLLAQLGAEFVHLRGGQVPSEVEPPSDLFIATTRRALIAEPWPIGAGAPQKIAVVTEDSNTLRNRLRRAGFDLLIRRPVHPYALRLVLLKGLYSGAERRQDPRVPIGYPVRYRIGLRHRKAWIADLSLSGGRLLVKERLAPGTRLTIQLPSGVTDGRGLSLRGSVLRVSAAGENSGGASYAAAIHFEKLSMNARRRIFNILNDRVHGPAVLPAPVGLDQRVAVPDPIPAAAPATPEDRRKHERVLYERAVATPGEAQSVLMGRNLSMGGMRIEPHAGLALGDQLELALYGDANESPIRIQAEVVHDEESGLGLRFLEVAPGVAERLEKLITHLPAVEPLQDGESDSMGSIVSSILEHRSESDEDEV